MRKKKIRNCEGLFDCERSNLPSFPSVKGMLSQVIPRSNSKGGRVGGLCKRKLAGYWVITALVLVPAIGWTGDQVPFKANLVLQATIAQVNTCSSGTVLLQISGGGYATHLGATTDQQSHCQNFVTGAFSNGLYTFTAANGDTIFGTYSGQLIPAGNAFAIDGQFNITGGTGRFAGASGGGGASGTQSSTGEANLVLMGTISSLGSN